MDKVTGLHIKAESELGFNFEVRAWTDVKIWCVKGIFKLKALISEKNLGFNGVILNTTFNNDIKSAQNLPVINCCSSQHTVPISTK